MNGNDLSIQSRNKELINKLHEIEDSLISDDRLKATVITAGNQLRKVFGEDGYYDKYMQSVKTSDILGRQEDDILENMISPSDKVKIVSTKAITNGKIINVMKNSLLISYLLKNNIVPKKDISEIQTIFKEGNNVLQDSLESNVFDKEKIDALEKYVSYLSDNKEYLEQNMDEIINSFENLYSLNSVLSHELAHHIFKEFINLKGRTYVALNESYSFAIQKTLHLFDKKDVSYQDVQKEILGLYKIIPMMKETYGEDIYMFMKSFIPLLGGFTIANAIGLMDNDISNQVLFNQSYDQKSYTGFFSSYDKVIDNIKDVEIKSILQKVKNTSLHQLGKCREKLKKDAKDSIDNFDGDDKIRIRAKMFVRTLELLLYAGEEKNIVIQLQKEYFTLFFDVVGRQMGYDDKKDNIVQNMRIIIETNEFNPEKMIDLIDET